MLDFTLVPVITQLKADLDNHKKALESFYPKNVIERACYEYAQSVLLTNPRILMPTQEAVAFYRHLCNSKNLKEIVFQQEKLRFSKELPTLVGENTERAMELLTKFRLARIKKYQPGVFSEYLKNNGCIQPNKPADATIPKRTVRFA